MTFNTKLSPGDTAWFMHENKATPMVVGFVTAHQGINEQGRLNLTRVDYGFRLYDAYKEFKGWLEVSESLVFATKEELLASL